MVLIKSTNGLNIDVTYLLHLVNNTFVLFMKSLSVIHRVRPKFKILYISVTNSIGPLASLPVYFNC